MKHIKYSLIIIMVIVLGLSSIKVGYGYWTDKLMINGSATYAVGITIEDDEVLEKDLDDTDKEDKKDKKLNESDELKEEEVVEAVTVEEKIEEEVSDSDDSSTNE